MRLRVFATKASTGESWIGKNRIRCSGGGSSTMLLGGAVINSLSQKSERDVSDIIYVATGVSGS